MNTLKFKTTINCASCVAKVSPILDAQNQISKWEVDTTHPDKILRVEGEQIDEEELVRALKKIGYQAQRI